MKTLEKIKNSIWFSFCIHLVVMIFACTFMYILYESNDDIAIRQLINGSKAVSDPHILFQNIILGFLYRIPYSVTCRFPWYDIIQFMAILFAFVVSGYVILNKLNLTLGLAVTMILQCFFAFECYVKPQFTKTAGVLAAAGMLMLIFYIENEKSKIWQFILGMSAIALGFMYRYQEAIICIILIGVLSVRVLFQAFRKSLDDRKKIFIKAIYAFFAGIVVLGALYGVDKISYKIDPYWKEFKEFNAYRSGLLDYGLPNYSANKELYDELEINEDAVRLLYLDWNYNDPDKFNIEVLKKLAAAKEEKQFGKDTFFGFWSMLPVILKISFSFICVVLMFVLWLIWGSKRGGDIAAIFLEILAFLVFYMYLYYQGRFALNRVDVGMWFSMSLLLGYLLNPQKDVSLKNIRIILTLVPLIIAIGLGTKQSIPLLKVNNAELIQGMHRLREVLEILGTDKEHLYIIKSGCVSEQKCYGTFDAMPKGILDNLCWLNGWDCNLRGPLKTLENYNVKNPYRDLINREDIYLVDNDIDITLRYINTYYDEAATAEYVKRIGNIDLYKIVSPAGGK